MREIVIIRDGIFIVAVHVDYLDRVFVAVALTEKRAVRKLDKIVDQHHHERPKPIGQITQIEERAEGLYVKGQLNSIGGERVNFDFGSLVGPDDFNTVWFWEPTKQKHIHTYYPECLPACYGQYDDCQFRKDTTK